MLQESKRKGLEGGFWREVDQTVSSQCSVWSLGVGVWWVLFWFYELSVWSRVGMDDETR